ncbi:MAG: hypothetical protein K6T51_09435 [Rubrobacteraceae bacterium]|nr:hypothetical protein [Rubrobacteraceae bacterium]MCL6438822.1 hypothetical protein [Rubrobacteraceae bacterium]
MEIQEPDWRVAGGLKRHGVLGRFAIDFVSVRREGRWEHRTIKTNLRTGDTTHPYIMQFLTDGYYDPEGGLYHTPTG